MYEGGERQHVLFDLHVHALVQQSDYDPEMKCAIYRRSFVPTAVSSRRGCVQCPPGGGASSSHWPVPGWPAKQSLGTPEEDEVCVAVCTLMSH